jgi:hypothetical protein
MRWALRHSPVEDHILVTFITKMGWNVEDALECDWEEL